ncbi:beta-lactamase-like protein [Bisporella sp. PMI_857]|nr:beta-lactamase-like protein [Bisporella sp. PMI_857]
MYIPSSEATVEVQFINTTTNITIGPSGFVQPILPGHEKLHLPTFCFLIKNRALNERVLFDCGARKNWRDLPPHLVDVIAEADISIEKSVDEILVEGGFELRDLSSIIWSHWHWDHIGDPTRFHPDTEIVVGPLFKKHFMPGYPVSADGQMLQSDFENRVIREIEFSDSLRIGDFQAFDFFGDGSFYLLNVPGHAIGHIAALARTSKTTFIFMAGDTCHFTGVFRPSPQFPLPTILPASVPLDPSIPKPCPASVFTRTHPCPEKALSKPFYDISTKEGGWYIDPKTAQISVNSLQEFDGNENILVILGHDTALKDITDVFPKGTANNWKEKGWKDRFAWNFLNELRPMM